MQRVLAIGIGGLVGTIARYGLSLAMTRRFGEAFPFGTLAVNLVGCLVAGFLFYLLIERLNVNEIVSLTILVGFLGGFTTFSAFGLQTFGLLREGQLGSAAANIVISNVGGLLLVWVGYALAKVIRF